MIPSTHAAKSPSRTTFHVLSERIWIIKIPHLGICVVIGIGGLLPIGVLLTPQKATFSGCFKPGNGRGFEWAQSELKTGQRALSQTFGSHRQQHPRAFYITQKASRSLFGRRFTELIALCCKYNSRNHQENNVLLPNVIAEQRCRGPTISNPLDRQGQAERACRGSIFQQGV